MASYDSQAVATALGDRIRAYLADGRAPRFSFAPTPNYATPALLSCLALLMVCVLMRNAFHQAGHLLLGIDRAHDELRVRRKLFGVPYGHQARFALAEVSDLQLEHGPVLDKLLTCGQLPAPGARFVLVRTGGQPLPGHARLPARARTIRARARIFPSIRYASYEKKRSSEGHLPDLLQRNDALSTHASSCSRGSIRYALLRALDLHSDPVGKLAGRLRGPGVGYLRQLRRNPASWTPAWTPACEP